MTTPSRTPAQTDERLEARAETPEDKLPTYQELLDDASDGSFPASDPPATGAATHTAQRISTELDDRDWKLKPTGSEGGSGQTLVAEFDDESAARQAQQRALQEDLPTARLDLPAQHASGPAATVTMVTCDDEQLDKAQEIVRGTGASNVEVRPSA